MAERFDWTWPPQVCYILNPANSLEPYVLNPAYSSIVTKFDLTNFCIIRPFLPDMIRAVTIQDFVTNHHRPSTAVEKRAFCLRQEVLLT